MTAVRISIHDKRYPTRGTPVIADFELTLASGAFVCLVGPSGCGKTTLLNIVAGLDESFAGDVSLGEPGGAHPKIGYVFQNPRLLPWRTVRENIDLVLDAKHDPALADSLLATMGLADMQHAYPERLSLGMGRRVAIIRAFAVNPDLLLMDEPFVSLDAPTARQVRASLLELWRQKPHTVLFVTHDLREAIALADTLVFLSAAPMRVVSAIPVTIPRENRDDESAIDAFRKQLIDEHPAIQSLL